MHGPFTAFVICMVRYILFASMRINMHMTPHAYDSAKIIYQKHSRRLLVIRDSLKYFSGS